MNIQVFAALGSWAGVAVTVVGVIFLAGKLAQAISDVRDDVHEVKQIVADHGRRIAFLEGLRHVK
jgi:hypothetical protein